MTRGSWQTVTLDPTADLALIWPDADARDNSMIEIEFHAVSRRRVAAEYFFGYLRFQEQSGYDPLGVDAALFARYAAATPTVLALNGTEISLAQHMNQYGGPQTPFDYGPVTSLRTDLGDLRADIAAHVHALGGVVSINHPFKPGDTGGNGTPESIAAGLLAIDAGGADMIETGYANKQGANLAQHIAVWDTLVAQRPVPHRQRGLRRPQRPELGRPGQPVLHGGLGARSARRPTSSRPWAPDAATSDTSPRSAARST